MMDVSEGSRGVRGRAGIAWAHPGGVRLLLVVGAAAGVASSASGQLTNLNGGENTGNQSGGGQPTLVTPGGAQPGVAAAPDVGVAGTYTLPAFAEGVDLKELVAYVVDTLKINVVVDPNLSGRVVINRAISVTREELLKLLNDLLEQQNYMIYRESSGWYQVVPNTVERIVPSDATTRLISTPNMKPSSLRSLVESLLPPSRAQGSRVVYFDDLGLIAITDTPRTVEAVSRVVEQVRDQMLQVRFFRVELKNISAPAARDRAIQLLGGTGSTSGQPEPTQQFPQFQQPGGQGVPGAGGATRTAGLITNIEQRLIVDAQGNALIFNGREEEMSLIRQIIERIDVATRLETREYQAGQYAEEIANLARAQGLGEVVVIEQDDQRNQNQFFNPFGQQQQQQQQVVTTGGSRMIVDKKRGKIVYFATPEQHEILTRLIKDIGLESDAVTIKNYPLQNADAEDVVDVLRQLILGEAAGGEGGLLPTQGGGQQQFINPFTGFAQPTGTPEVSLFGDAYTEIVADTANNQVLVRAPANLQPQYEKLIGDLDMRRQQVYIRANIVAVSNTASSRLAFETQIINAAGDPIIQTNFGLNQASATTDLSQPRVPLANLTGLTTAVIQSKYVPIIMHATATDTDSRIISSPQLLVNDNFEASIQAIDQQPTTTTTQTTGNPAQTSFGGYEDAGTTLTVTPSISANGWIRMEYEITLSNFVGTSTGDGVPPPKQDRTVRSDAVTVPSDATIVVGGIVVDDTRNTVVKIPLIGDIPLVGNLFRDTNKSNSSAILYVFITPYIMSDTSFQDMRLLTRGPQSEVDFPDGLPHVEPRTIEIITPTPTRLEP